jgi:predicted AAA+ superfamily ATPase
MTGFFFDEVRSFENIGNILKGFVDNYNKKILCSSSGNINIVSSIAHNLTGRYEIIQVYPLDFEEYLEDLDNDLFFQYKNLTPNLN